MSYAVIFKVKMTFKSQKSCIKVDNFNHLYLFRTNIFIIYNL